MSKADAGLKSRPQTLVLQALVFLIACGFLWAGDGYAQTAAAPKNGSTADHSKFEALQKDFAIGPEVTAACLDCHTEAAKQLHKTTHWTWAFNNELTGQELGKRNVVNNFCVATATNWPRCTSCHIGYGWKDESFDLTSEKNVDCLACHDTTGTYKKFPTGSGHPAYEDKEFSGKLFKAVDLKKVAQSVGQPTRQTCGACHFYGGGGNGVKHGDLDSSMANPDKDLDVHMDADGLNFTCQRCHQTGSHQVAGSRYVTKAVDREGIVVPGKTTDLKATCESCHGMRPHPDSANAKLNDHTDKLACTTCHVPEYARGGFKTKMWWDWSTAGQKKDGKGLIKKDADGYPTYHFKKGDFVWEDNVVPEYAWFDGEVRYTLLGDPIDVADVVPINTIGGSPNDPDSRIWPFKVMRGRQPYDTVNQVIGVPHLFGKDEDAFWKSFDWGKALENGLMARGIKFSGEYDFLSTEYYWPITHMVAPKEKSLACDSCHSHDGRMAGIPGIYMTGRDRFGWLDQAGWALVLLTLAGVLGHAAVRVVTRNRRAS